MHTVKLRHFARAIAGAGLALALSFAPISPAKPGKGQPATPGLGAPFSGIYAFGDSLTDTGNFFDLTLAAIGVGLPPAPYYDGRLSNGLVWIEYVAEQMGLDPDSIVSYAVAGATSGRDNENDDDGYGVEFPGLQDELDQFEEDLGGKRADKRALYIVWAGANDFLIDPAAVATNPFGVIGNGVSNTMTAVQRLYDAGARRIMVVNLPDLGLTPAAKAEGPAYAGGLSFLSAFYNDSLADGLDGLEAMGIETIRVDSAGVLQAIAGDPGEFGFTNVCDPYLPVGITAGADPSEFLFWDTIHPTTKGHAIVAEEALRVLGEKFPHVWIP